MTETPPSAEWVIFPISGEVDLVAAQVLRQQFADATEPSPCFVVADLSRLTFIDSSGLGVLVGGLRRVRAGGGDMRIAGARPGIHRVLAVTGLDRVISVFDTVALATADGPAPTPLTAPPPPVPPEEPSP